MTSPTDISDTPEPQKVYVFAVMPLEYGIPNGSIGPKLSTTWTKDGWEIIPNARINFGFGVPTMPPTRAILPLQICTHTFLNIRLISPDKGPFVLVG